MAIRLFRVVVVSLAVLVLGSCDVLQYVFGSVFPSTLTLIKDQADLSGMIAASNSGSTYLRLVETGGYGYVIVTGSPSPSEYFAFFYDLNLKLVKSLTGTSAPQGTGVMVDAGGRIAVGNEFFNPADLSFAGNNSATVYAQGNSGTDGVLSNGQNVIGIFVNPSSSNMLSYTYYAAAWTGGSTPTPLPTLSSSTFGLQVNAVFDDGAGNVIMVISQGSSGGNNDTVNARFVTVPESAFTGTFPTNAFDSAPQRNNLVSGSFGFADGSLFAYDNKASSLVRIRLSDAGTQNSLPLNNNNISKVRYVYRLSGGAFYTFDTDSRMLTKYVAWW